MPEGHVIHRLARTLTDTFGGKPVDVSSPQGRFSTEADVLNGAELIDAFAHGKQLFIRFAGERYIHIHLGLIGKFKVAPLAAPVGVVRLRIADGEMAADLHGPQWCRLVLKSDVEKAVEKLGSDPLENGAIAPNLARVGRTIGAALMDQSLYAGVGNIYRCEVLFRQRISPFAPAVAVDGQAIWDDLVQLMEYGARTGRIDTVRAEHSPEAQGRPPREDAHGGEVYVYRRAGQPCLVCGTPVEMTVDGGRKLYWCPTCQA
ncbi:Fpg/Nei family DNA glycosylase [Corynebacterium glucuronolyticum]|uniref:DNA-(apurinic or apyrimidinic site) lyase n=2 Tax=Corynebacterium glucuronolyticum TaxID=39791 RepID=A0AAX1L887_9CORY|nr:zinc finger domain-containing protein [Corynebacterium glucuronolyticum]EEI63929.1 Formamidopyrimidine-DNA glycosylase N-terminal domain protein [Corynebacterium glucuronolyticum ATCC 51866]MCT1442962.1 Fpg/Nei family DNA glycosylase [Corynebacterium glucuronolyticum]MCT1564413.1 Fpg/Nei family DNA glycosylase [Corynebacterium glucuronolyticum]QQU88518.1 Fpg/Nei family DNA glycosylase [Corynebacterium glucuronolyticum]QRP70609.1 Fpg/Nei family DNA glycosylase [Corynebacterium glucuronolytic